MRKQKLSDSQAKVLEKIAKHSKMDAWFSVDENGVVNERDIINLIDGATEHDFSVLSSKDMCTLSDILVRCKPIN